MIEHAHWIQTLGGRQLDYLDPRPEAIHWPTVATVLARVPRYAGHTERGTYSVAQHCEQGARAIVRDTGRRDYAAAFLLHDVHEYVIGDDANPKVSALAAMADEMFPCDHGGEIVKGVFRELKRRLDVAIHYAAGFDAFPLDPDTSAVVRRYDLRMLRTERDALLSTPPQPWVDAVEQAEPIEDLSIAPCSERYARSRFLVALHELCPRVIL
ncbi:MAG: hypothetical protein HXX10_07445 [Rhodoplanes sp.]|uniref:hypothetical protein n=1 Tax=Rhodoplanes sp. TaxID=1968906 RepID=UPI0017E2194C|nr:hypothetical protein [Rhodoplanes sp.]NVO13854.1 hypothetical protein [Rhodoplanes sp.]